MSDILLYETYALRRESAFARTKDTELALTITLAVGKGVIVDAYALEAGTSTKITKAYVGQLIDLVVRVDNRGDADAIWIIVKDKDTGAIIKDNTGAAFDVSNPSVAAGGTWEVKRRNFVMPNKNWNLLVEAGHGV